jgi:hypothetical protein
MSRASPSRNPVLSRISERAASRSARILAIGPRIQLGLNELAAADDDAGMGGEGGGGAPSLATLQRLLNFLRKPMQHVPLFSAKAPASHLGVRPRG